MSVYRLSVATLVLMVGAVALTAQRPPERYDVLIRNGPIVDASGLVVAPGFIDLLGQSEFNVLVDGRAASKILQGVTTEITGEGTSIAPVNDRLIADASANAKHFGVV